MRQVQFIFSGPDGSTENLLIGTWSKKVHRSNVLKYGTSKDIAKFPPPTARNKVKRTGIARTSGPLRKKRKCPRRGESRGAIRRSIKDAARAEEEGDLADLTAIGEEEVDYYDPPSIE